MTQGLDTTPLIYDISNFVDYALAPGVTGISRVDLAYFSHFSRQDPASFLALHERFHVRTLLPAAKASRIVGLIKSAWQEDEDNGLLEAVLAWLATPAPAQRRLSASREDTGSRWALHAKLLRHWPWSLPRQGIPHGAMYFNTSYAGLLNPRHLSFLQQRPDIFPVFMVHDLLPLTRTDLFWRNAKDGFSSKIAAVIKHAGLVIVPSAPVKQTLTELAAQAGRSTLQIEVVHTPPAPEFLTPAQVPTLPTGMARYFVICGTIEPRKNHALLLDIWEKLACENASPPRLLIIGNRGWNNSDIVQRLETTKSLAGHVLEVNGLSSKGLQTLVRGAQAVLVPSLDEGYGMPVVEALASGTPVIASDIPVFREISANSAQLIPLYQPEVWRHTIDKIALSQENIRQWRERAAAFEPATWGVYFKTVLELAKAADRLRTHGMR